MNNSKLELRNYRLELKKMRPELLQSMKTTNLGKSLPRTFDSMMVDFGNNV